MATRSRVLAVALVGALLLSACLVTSTTDDQVITAPDAGATGFGAAFDMDEDRLVARADLPGGPVVYVFDAVGSTWVHTATIPAPPMASTEWATTVSVSGDLVAIGDSYTGFGREGLVEIYELDGGTWGLLTDIWLGAEASFGHGVWLEGDTLLAQERAVCDGVCGNAALLFFRRSGATFESIPGRLEFGRDMAVGIDQGRLSVARSAFVASSYQASDNVLQVFDVQGSAPVVEFEERIPSEWDIDEQVEEGFDHFTDADLSGDVLAYESCCSSEANLHIRRFDGTTYASEATFPVLEKSAGISVLSNELVLVADASERVWYVYAFHDGAWERATKLALPDGATFAVRPVAVGDRVAVSGGGAIHVLSVETTFHERG